jgi:hypothetical protein
MARCPLVRPAVVRLNLGANLQDVTSAYAKKHGKEVAKLSDTDKVAIQDEFYSALLVATNKSEVYVDVKKELTSGEHREMFVSQLNATALGDRPTLDLQNVGINKVLAYVVDWNFVDFDDKPLAITREALDKFNSAEFQEIVTAVDAHHEAWEKAVDARKNALAGATESSKI